MLIVRTPVHGPVQCPIHSAPHVCVTLLQARYTTSACEPFVALSTSPSMRPLICIDGDKKAGLQLGRWFMHTPYTDCPCLDLPAELGLFGATKQAQHACPPDRTSEHSQTFAVTTRPHLAFYMYSFPILKVCCCLVRAFPLFFRSMRKKKSLSSPNLHTASPPVSPRQQHGMRDGNKRL